MNRTLIVFAKEPVPGMVKTRLKSCFSDADLTRLYKAFVKDTLAIANKTRNTKKVLAFSSDRIPRFLERISGGFEMIEQRGRTLGDRMHNAFVYARENRSKKTVIIGADSPTLPLSMIEKAFRALSRKDVVLGPAIDGGYYLIGLKAPCVNIFKGVHWSSSAVMRRTLRNAKGLGKTVVLLNQWYDVDDCVDLRRLRMELTKEENLNIAQNTRAVLSILNGDVR